MKNNKENIEWEKIDNYIEQNKNRKPPMVAVDEKHWKDALDGMREIVSNTDSSGFSTQTMWNLIWTSAMEFCRGMEYAEVLHGKREESNYPRM